MKAPKRLHNPGQETFDPSERAAEQREHEERKGIGHVPVQTRAARKAVDDGCFALSLRLPNEYKFAVTMEALQAESVGEFVLRGRRDSRQAYLEHILLMHLEDLKERHPNPKAR